MISKFKKRKKQIVSFKQNHQI